MPLETSAPYSGELTSQSVKRSLVADDQILLSREGDDLIAQPPSTLAGLIEIRGLGIFKMPFFDTAKVHFFVDLVEVKDVPRMIEETCDVVTLLGLERPVIKLNAFEPSAVLKLHYAFQMFV